MARVRKIKRDPAPGRNYFLVDANFLANRYIPIDRVPAAPPHERTRIERCNEWWGEIEAQLDAGKARVYIPDICIAETFKVLAKKYYDEKWFRSSVELNNARRRLRDAITTPRKTLMGRSRKIRFHDISTCRDIIIAVDRFYESFLKNHKSVSIPDLIIIATAKYLLDFYDIPKRFLHIVTLDTGLWEGLKRISEIPNAYNPTRLSDSRDRVFD